MEFITIFLLCCIATFRATLGAPTNATAAPFMYSTDYIEANNLCADVLMGQHYWTGTFTELSCALDLMKQMADLYLAEDWSHFNKLDVPRMCPKLAAFHADEEFPRRFNDSLSEIPKRFRDQFTDEERNQIITSVTTGCRVGGSKNLTDVRCLLGKLAQAVAFFEERALSPYQPFRAWARILLQIYHDCNSAGSIVDSLIMVDISAGHQLPGCFIQAIEKVVSTTEWTLKDLITALPEFKILFPDELIQQIPLAQSMMSQSQTPNVTLV